MLIIILVLIFLFLLNFHTYWILILKQKLLNSKLSDLYKKLFPIIWIICVFLIPIVNSSLFQPFFNENVSYFHQYWIWFIFIGIIIIVLGIKIHTLATKLLETAINEGETPILIRKGVYEIVRHPQYLSWFLVYLGITFIFDSFIAVIISPIFLILTELLCFLEEKYLLISKFEKKYDQYKKKTPYRLISPPYNYIFIIMGIIVVYIGFLNIVNI